MDFPAPEGPIIDNILWEEIDKDILCKIFLPFLTDILRSLHSIIDSSDISDFTNWSSN